MENKKTISHLKSKVWYRLIKVFFFLALLIVLGEFNLIAFSGGVKQIDQNKTKIQCTYGDKKVFTPQSLNLSLDEGDFKNGVFDYKGFFLNYNAYKISDIFQECYPSYNSTDSTLSPDVFGVQKVYEVYGNDRLIIKREERPSLSVDEIKTLDEILPKIENSITPSQKAKYLDFSIKLFDITPAFTYAGFLKLFFIGNFVILLIFEAIRRIFYYIVLGSIKPKK